MMELIHIQKAKLERNRLIIDDNVTLEEWKEIGQALKQVEGSVQFWIGDWARFGEKQGFTGKYVAPAVYDELEEVTGYSRSTIQKFKYVADSTAEIREDESLLRSKDVAFGQYENVASLAPAQQKEFLQKASEEKLTTRELRDEVKQFKHQNNEMTTEDPENEKRVETDYSQIQTLRRLERKREAENEIIALARKLRKDFKKENYQVFIQVFTNTLNK